MHEHDESLIIELLDDTSLSEAAVSTRLDGCAQCISDFAGQRAMMQLLATLPAPSMTDHERRSLRRAVNEELTESNVVTMPLRARRWDWTRLGTVAAALLGVFVIGGIVTSLGNDVSEQADTLAAATSDGAVEETAEMAAADTADDAAADALPAEEAGGDEGVASLTPRSRLVIDLGPLDTATFAVEVRAVTERVSSSRAGDAIDPLDLDPNSAACLGEFESDVPPSGVIVADVDGTPVVVYFDEEGAPTGFTTPDCAPYPLP